MERKALVTASVQPGGRAPAPPPLDLVQAFVNTVDREHGPDLLDAAAGLTDWLDARPWPTDPGPVDAAGLRAARELREALRTLLWANNGHAADVAGAVAIVEAAGQRARLTVRLQPPRLEPRAGGLDGVLGAIVAAVHAAMADGRWERLKACPGRNCGWAFYDRSVNASASWCSMRVCGGRMKARAYYRRRRTG